MNSRIQLYPDCLRRIFEYIVDSSEYLHITHKNLYSCILVNKLFFQNAIPILWRNPWNPNSNKSKNNYNKKLSIARTILSCLLQYHREQQQDKNLTDIFGLISFENPMKDPIFDYVSYCRHINCLDIENVTRMLIENKRELNVIFDKKHEENIVGNEMNQSINKNFIGLANICHNLTKIRINPLDKDDRGLATLIKAQNNLEEIHLFTNQHVENLRFINQALSTKSNSLEILSFKGNFYFSSQNSFLSSLHNLKQLHIKFATYSNINCLLNLTVLPNAEYLNSIEFDFLKVQNDENYDYNMERELQTKSLLDALIAWSSINLNYLYLSNLWWLLPHELSYFLELWKPRNIKLTLKIKDNEKEDLHPYLVVIDKFIKDDVLTVDSGKWIKEFPF
ncbi:21761_t:CDS:2 [Rhizophagus irregularis]|nr:21761_t:CDS:2 [Rhizophagus irregularis]